MSYDDKLIDAVIAALPGSSRDELAELAQNVLRAIDASGTHWLAPAELTPQQAKRGAAMVLDTQMASGHPERGGKFNDFELPMAVAWRSCLAERAVKSDV